MYWQTLLWPFRPSPLIALCIYTLVAFAFTAWAALNFWVGVLVVAMGSPIWFSVFGLLSLWAEKVLTQTATGLFDERIDGETDLNPFTRGGLAMKLCLAHLIVFVILLYNGPVLHWGLLIPAFFFPLIWLNIVLDESLLGAFEPKKMLRVLTGLSISYPLAMLLISGSVGYMHYSLLYASSLINIVASATLFLWANILFGLLLFSRRAELNLHTMKSPEQDRAAELIEQEKVIDDLFHSLHSHARTGNFRTAIALLEEFIASDTEILDPLMHERLLDFQESRLCLEHAVRYLQRLVDRGEERKAWSLMKECLDTDEKFRPPKDDTLLRLTRAADRKDAALVNQLLSDFDRCYPDSPLIADARFRRARICIELLKDGDTGVALLTRIATDHPEFAQGDAYQRYRRRIKTR